MWKVNLLQPLCAVQRSFTEGTYACLCLGSHLCYLGTGRHHLLTKVHFRWLQMQVFSSQFVTVREMGQGEGAEARIGWTCQSCYYNRVDKSTNDWLITPRLIFLLAPNSPYQNMMTSASPHKLGLLHKAATYQLHCYVVTGLVLFWAVRSPLLPSVTPVTPVVPLLLSSIEIAQAILSLMLGVLSLIHVTYKEECLVNYISTYPI